MAKNTRSHGQMKAAYSRLMLTGRQRMDPEAQAAFDPLAALVETFRARRETGEKVSIRQFCGEHHLSQKQFEARLKTDELPAPFRASETDLAYYARPEVQATLFLWAQGRRLAPHYGYGLIGQGFRRPEDVPLLAAAGNTRSPTFHASVGRYDGQRLVAFDLVAEVDHKGDWKECFRVTRPLVHALHSAGVTFLVKFSGHSSAHVVVPCRGMSYARAAEAFLSRARRTLLRTDRLDFSFRHPQHFLRMPYALHERTGLVSLPLSPEEFEAFDPDRARPENVTVESERLQKVLAADNLGWLQGG